MQWTDEQQAVINHHGGHAIVTAVAGSGKTSTLVAHVLQQLERGQDPRRILVLMFNRRAREDFERKLARSATVPVTLPDIRTYHSMGLRLYQSFVRLGQLPAIRGEPLTGKRLEFECWKILTRIAPASMQESLKNDKSSWVSDTVSFIELVKSTIRSPEEVFEEYDFDAKQTLLVQAYHAFEEWRLAQGLITYSDMLYQPVMAMLRQPELVKRVTNRMDLMLVDEYQDTNEVQHTLLKMIAGQRASVMVVGDPDQTIYEFRGARPEYILRTFAEDFPSPVHYTLSYTFRYGHALALLANHLIVHNQNRHDVQCIAHSTTPATQIEQIESQDHAGWLIQKIVSLQDEGHSLSDIAILARLWSQSVTLELALLEAQIPFFCDGEKSAFDRQEIQVLLELLALAAGDFRTRTPEERFQAFWQILRFPHIGIADKWLRPFCQKLSQQEDNFGRWLMKQSERALPELSDFQKRRMLERGRLLLHVEQAKEPAGRLMQRYVVGVDMAQWLTDSALNSERAEEQLLATESFCRFLEKTTMDSGTASAHIKELQQRRQHQRKQRASQQSITLTSMHKAKGLEWPIVILPSLIDKQLPCQMGSTPLTAEILESERRLFYVAMTRAKENLLLLTVPKPAKGARSDRMPSRFMAQLQDALSSQAGQQLHQSRAPLVLDYPRSEVLDRYLAQEFPSLAVQMSAKATKAAKKKPALGRIWQRRKVIHSIFGEGAVLSETNSDFRVRFEDGATYDFSKKSAHLYFS